IVNDVGMKGVPLGRILAGQDGSFRAQAMLGGVARGAFFARVGARPGSVRGHGEPRGGNREGARNIPEATAGAYLGGRGVFARKKSRRAGISSGQNRFSREPI